MVWRGGGFQGITLYVVPCFEGSWRGRPGVLLEGFCRLTAETGVAKQNGRRRVLRSLFEFHLWLRRIPVRVSPMLLFFVPPLPIAVFRPWLSRRMLQDQQVRIRSEQGPCLPSARRGNQGLLAGLASCQERATVLLLIGPSFRWHSHQPGPDLTRNRDVICHLLGFVLSIGDGKKTS